MMKANKESTGTHPSASTTVANFLEEHSGKVILTVLVLTLLLVIPLLMLGTDELASEDPQGEVFDLRDDINERFSPQVHYSLYIVESRNGDILIQESLWELYQNEQKLREADSKGTLAPEGLPSQRYLYETYDIPTNRPFRGLYTIADAVQDVLTKDSRFSTGLETATDEQVKLALHYLLNNPDTSEFKEWISVEAKSEKRTVLGMEIDYWTSPAITFIVVADNEKLGGGTLEIAFGGGETVQNKEELNRNIQQVLRGDEKTFRLWGTAIDLNLEAGEEGQIAGYFIMATVIAVVLIAGVSLRSYWATALTGTGLGFLMVWLKGISNLVGLKGGLVIDLIVPIAMISLGVDFALHALRRYQEERRHGFTPGTALRAGFVGVLGALVLAMASDSIAFLSNTSSGIEAVIHFGIAAAIAVISSFLILGIVLPLVMTYIDKLQPPPAASLSRRRPLRAILNSLAMAAGTGAGVIFLVAVSEVLGVVVLLMVSIVFVVIPLFVMRRRQADRYKLSRSDQPESGPTYHERDSWFSNCIAGIARYRIIVLVVALGITIVATVYATRLEATFDAKDFFSSSSDFVVSLDKMDEHFGERGGEPGIAYIKGDLTDINTLSAIKKFIEDSEVWIEPRTIIAFLEYITDSPYAVGRIVETTGVQVTDNDNNGLPDSQAQVEAAYVYGLRDGVSLDENMVVFTPAQVREVLFHEPESGQEDVTILYIGIPGTREQQNVIEAHELLTDSLKGIHETPAISFVGLAGSPFTRLAQLEATTKTLQRSLAIAAAATLVLLLIAMRSFRHALVTIIPIGLVVAWLYGLMYLLNFPLNYVTATIGAVSLGVGIDYSIHVTQRFREEMRRAANKVQALRQVTNGTGVALLASAVSSIVGFAIMGFAPMPVFSTYGILTAVMIFLAMLASLVVLPSLLLLVTRE